MKLPVMEHFYTLQGEGQFTGHAAYFIRLGGCDVGCTWCDVKESWDMHAHPQIEVDELIQHVLQSGTLIAVITGGEPTMHYLNELTTQLQKHKIRCHIETSGTHPLSGSWDWVCFSPKRFKKALPEYYTLADELKTVIYHENDLRWAQQHAEKCNNKTKCYIQAEWGEREKITPLLIDFIKQHPKWALSLQTHKYLNIP